MNILVVEARESVGGGQIMTKKVCDALSENNQVSVFLPGNDKSPIAKLSN